MIKKKLNHSIKLSSIILILKIKSIIKKILPKKLIKAIKLLAGTHSKKIRALNRIGNFYRKNKSKDFSRTVIFFSRGSEFMITFESFLALTLRAMGTKCIFVICDGLDICNFSSINRSKMKCQSCYSGYKIPHRLGFEVHKLSEFFQKNSEIKESPDSLNDFINFKIFNIKVGKYLKPSVLRYFMASEFKEVNEDELRKVYFRFISVSVSIYNAINNIIEKFKPQIALMFNGRYSQMRVAYETFRKFNINCTTYESLNIPHGQYWIFSNHEPVMSFQFAQEWNKWKKKPSPTPYWTKYKNVRKNEIRLEEKIIAPFEISKAYLFLTNIRWELSNMALESPFRSMEHCITDTIDYCIKNNKKLIIRIHPNDSSEYEGDIAPTVYEYLTSKYNNFPDNIWIIKPEDKVDSYVLVEKCKRVIVWTSTIGLETAYEGRRPIVTAQAYYAKKGFTRDIISKDDYFKALEEDDNLSDEQMELANRYASFLLLRKKIPLSLFKTRDSYDVSGFQIIKYHKNIKTYDPYYNEILKFVCDNIINNGEFVLPDCLVAKTYDKHIFPMLNR